MVLVAGTVAVVRRLPRNWPRRRAGAAAGSRRSGLDGQVRTLADRLGTLERIDVLVNNAGLMAGQRRVTADGFEEVFAVNHLAPFLLTNLLLGKLAAAAPPG